ncbi:hypothetical protein DPMN_020491 [Dreissena polymorpha]|uniref:Uncharacterized protein n=1 Tax=Dreissena polymorpha TaxID=45954 RepID=A0A9D4NIY6_DREPO|nr:hypothetical protein DPMN_020491 [Dreissena polymorpha]
MVYDNNTDDDDGNDSVCGDHVAIGVMLIRTRMRESKHLNLCHPPLIEAKSRVNQIGKPRTGDALKPCLASLIRQEKDEK